MAWFYRGANFIDPNDTVSPQNAQISILADEETDLPTVAEVETETGVYSPMIGSSAYVIGESSTYIMQSDGTWVKQEDSAFKDVYTKTETDNAITTAIESLDASSAGGTGYYISAISQTDGVISATASALTDTVASGNYKPITSNAVDSALTAFERYYFLGEAITTATDLNDLTTPGIYRTESGSATGGLTHKPDNTYGDVSGRGATIIVQYNGNTNYIRQEYHPGWNANQDDKFFVRHLRGPYSATDPRTGWSNWYVYEGTDTGS
jgi:hypothetical protein